MFMLIILGLVFILALIGRRSDRDDSPEWIDEETWIMLNEDMDGML